MPICSSCGKDVEETCGGDYCRDCHVSCSWEDCITGTFEARNILKSGVYTKEEVLKIYPEAKI